MARGLRRALAGGLWLGPLTGGAGLGCPAGRLGPYRLIPMRWLGPMARGSRRALAGVLLRFRRRTGRCRRRRLVGRLRTRLRAPLGLGWLLPGLRLGARLCFRRLTGRRFPCLTGRPGHRRLVGGFWLLRRRGGWRAEPGRAARWRAGSRVRLPWRPARQPTGGPRPRWDPVRRGPVRGGPVRRGSGRSRSVRRAGSGVRLGGSTLRPARPGAGRCHTDGRGGIRRSAGGHSAGGHSADGRYIGRRCPGRRWRTPRHSGARPGNARPGPGRRTSIRWHR
jgi:hypothetical protein